MSSKFKKAIRLIHLWLGLGSGLVVFIVAITGAIWSFESEISDLCYGYRKVSAMPNKPTISLQEVKVIVQPYLNKINSVSYLGADRSIQVREWYKIDGKLINNYLYIHPQTGQVLKVQLNDPSFFDIVVELHTCLLLGEWGTEIVRYATLIFFLLLVSGIILWWPKKGKNISQRLRFEWKFTTKWRRKNFDLHAILGFYSAWIILFAAMTGLAWGFKWVDQSIYAIASMGAPYQDYTELVSLSDPETKSIAAIEDRILHDAIGRYTKPIANWYYYFPQSETESVSLYLNPDADTWYQSTNYYYDQRNGQLLQCESNATFNNGQKLRNMYFDIHIGKILGIPGQLLMFFASLIVASLPITGFLIWWGRRLKKVS
jgi:uncharacterized iron-regulated membrane protein